jgi:hypothetical protein
LLVVGEAEVVIKEMPLTVYPKADKVELAVVVLEETLQ